MTATGMRKKLREAENEELDFIKKKKGKKSKGMIKVSEFIS